MISVKKPGTPKEVLEHHGIKGMRWGHRKSGGSGTPGRFRRTARRVGNAIDDTAFSINSVSDTTSNKIAVNASKKLKQDLPAIKAKHGDYGKLRNRVKKPFSKEAKAYRKDVSKTYVKHLESSANEITNRRGSLKYTLSEHGKPNTSQYFWKVSTAAVTHADSATSIVRPIFDSEGYIIDLKVEDNSLAQSNDLVDNILRHFGTEKIK